MDDTAANLPDFTDLQTAINSVADGDVLLLKTGTYPRMEVIGKSLTIVADAGEFPVVDASPQFGVRARVSSIGPSQALRIQGVQFRETGPEPVVELTDSAGNIWLENCTIQGIDFSTAVQVYRCASVVLLGVTASGGAAGAGGCTAFGSPAGAGLTVADSSISCYGCTFAGGDGGWNLRRCDFFDKCSDWGGAEGVSSYSSSTYLMLSACSITGGDSPGSYLPCDLVGGSPNRGGIGLMAYGGSANVLECLLAGGQGVGGVGSPYVGTPTFLPGRALRVTPGSPVRENQSAHVHLEGPSSVPVWMAMSPEPDTLPAINLLRGTALLSLSPVPKVRFLGVTSAMGILDMNIPVGVLPAGTDARLTFAQFYYLESPTLPGGHFALLQPPASKVFVLGGAILTPTLDEAF
ncbi:MAG: hypothetical protein ABL998_02070 [Planctomycetota bacterium]